MVITAPALGPASAGWMFNLGLGVSERGQSVQCLQFGAKPISPLEVPGPLSRGRCLLSWPARCDVEDQDTYLPHGAVPIVRMGVVGSGGTHSHIK